MRCLIRLLLVVALLAAACAGVAVWLARGAVLETQHGDYSDGPKAVEVTPGMSAQRIFEKLEAAGVLSPGLHARTSSSHSTGHRYKLVSTSSASR